MADEPTLLNDALSQIGAARIGSIDDGSTNANHCQVFYPTLRDGLLRSHFWNFALTWVELAAAVPSPVIGYAFRYPLPGDFLRIKQYAGDQPVTVTGIPVPFYDSSGMPQIQTYKIEGRNVVSNDGKAFIQYVRRVTNPDEWDPLFYQVLATWLASKLAMAIPKDEKKSLALLQQVQTILLPLALAVDGQEGSIEPYIVDDLLWGRQ